MDTAEQLRLLEAAQGNPVKLALANVDLTYPGLAAVEREQLKESLLTAAIPHWCDEIILATLMEVTATEAEVRLTRLRGMRVVETFPSRGPNAVNVHEATRLVLRAYLAAEKSEWFAALTRRAYAYFAPAAEPHIKIEAAFHHALIEPVSGADAIDALYLDWFLKGLIPEKLALAVALDELHSFHATPPLPRAVAAHRLADIRHGRQPVAKSLSLANEALAVYRINGDSLRTCRVLGTVGGCLQEMGQPEAALKAYTETVAISRKRVAETPNGIEQLRNLCISLQNVGDIANKMRRFDNGRLAYAETLQLRQKIALLEPDNKNWQRLVAMSLICLGDLDQAQGKLDDARRFFDEALELSRQLVALEPTNTLWQIGVSVCLNRLGNLHLEQGGPGAARHAFLEALEISRQLAKLDPADTTLQRSLAVALDRVGDVDSAQDRIEDALRSFSEAIEISHHIAALDPFNSDLQVGLAVRHYNLAFFASQHADETTSFSELRACYEVFAQMDQNKMTMKPELANIYRQLARDFGK